VALSVIRFDFRAPGMDAPARQALYATALEMAEFADKRGFTMVVLSEHHRAEDGYLPSPVVAAAAVAARTTTIGISISALLAPLYDPIRLAEDLAILDHLAAGRVAVVTGLGYRPVEYEMMGVDWSTRGKRLDHCLETLLQAWTGEPFTYEGRPVQVLPRPFTDPHPLLFVGGATPAAAKRAARYGLSFFPQLGDESLAEVYRSECERLGKPVGIVALPSGPGSVFVAEDPDKAWAEVGPHLLHDAVTYAGWQLPGISSHVKSTATTVDELRTEGVYQILTPDECVALAPELGPLGPFTHHPLCGGTPADLAWASLELFVDKVLPRI
jgi:alkanesulfonate monooxygenase SsuD/methylene tetrahydromethanopterin reductase-like flavin-dependent oxidoreductase (luciferase family)